MMIAALVFAGCSASGGDEPGASKGPAAAAALEAAPASASGAAADSKEARIAKGEYLVMLGGCHDCHTPGTFYGAPDMSRALSGSDVGWRGPWGVTYPRNLTPHESGLATWSEEDIVKALRTGVRPDGSGLKPPMPWQNYVKLTDEDAFAIAAYLKSIPPVEHAVPAATLPDAEVEGSIITIPPPPAWDAPR